MTKTLLALAAIACASPALAQVNGFYDSQRSIYGGPTTYQWRDAPAPNLPPAFQYQAPRSTTCTRIGNQTFCD